MSKRRFKFGIGHRKLSYGKHYADVYVSRSGYRLPS